MLCWKGHWFCSILSPCPAAYVAEGIDGLLYVIIVSGGEVVEAGAN